MRVLVDDGVDALMLGEIHLVCGGWRGPSWASLA